MYLFLALTQVNWMAVVVVLFLSFALGAFWHSILFKKGWSEDSNSKYNSENHGNPAFIFGLSAVLHLIAITGLTVVIGTNSTALEGFIDGLLISLVWIATSIGVTYIFVGRTLRLFLIDAGFYVVFLSIAGLILGAWH
jgi:hypothetical protein